MNLHVLALAAGGKRGGFFFSFSYHGDADVRKK